MDIFSAYDDLPTRIANKLRAIRNEELGSLLASEYDLACKGYHMIAGKGSYVRTDKNHVRMQAYVNQKTSDSDELTDHEIVSTTMQEYFKNFFKKSRKSLVDTDLYAINKEGYIMIKPST